MVELDDLALRHVAGDRCETSISSTAPIAKLGATKQFAVAGRRLGRLAQRVDVEAGRADDGVDAGPEAGARRCRPPCPES